MTNAEQWLADLEAKAKAATPGPWQPGEILEIGTVRQANGHILADCRLQLDDGVKNSRFIAAANPATVLRLVNMVRWLAEGCDCDADTCLPGCTPQCVLEKAYAATGERHE